MDIKVNLENLTEEERNQLMELIEKGNVDKVGKPKYQSKYYYIDSWGKIGNCHWTEDIIDKNRYAFGNVFKTNEQAEFELERLKVLAEMQKIADKDEQPKWNGEYRHYFLRLLVPEEIINVISYATSMKYNDICFATKERAEECIATVGEDRIKKYYFRMEE